MVAIGKSDPGLRSDIHRVIGVAEEIGTAGKGGLLLIADHASNAVPGDIHLGVDPLLLDDHIAVDIGVAPLARALAHRLRCAAILASVSRLVIDMNREVDASNLIPTVSDGHRIPGNEDLDAAKRQERVDRFWHPYHALIAARIDERDPQMLVSLHSFTPKLTSRPEHLRPWQIGILYNEDDRAARIAIGLLARAGLCVGDNQPYSGRELNATMNRHAEARGLPYLGIEVRQDLIADAGGVAHFAHLLAPIIEETARLA